MKSTRTQMTIAALAAAAAGDLQNAMVASVPGGIEAQEAAGQAMLVASQQLPRDVSNATREQLEAIGFKFGADVDELFVAATLPTGWKKVAGDHPMHSTIVDDKGRERASIFYKAAFYDRRAHMRMTPRYGMASYFPHPTNPAREQTQVMDGGQLLHLVGDYLCGREGYDRQREIEDLGAAWLKDRFPNHRDPFAYWDVA